ncbi:PREDICTED: uncharacterized protein LOC104728292 [Camelina sativa]|uniref:Uncharacterized protein LOC104728292 n=1 Tax=Camelina sativa TaxID=90675 RepID=A0ABM1QL42_CAMSA|nr:PREDICTED: uncharacterized protein LOC104728292 [Camelina sativa]
MLQRKYNWDSGITEVVKENFIRVAKRRIKGIVSQAKKSGEHPIWIGPTLWVEMMEHWNTPESIEKSTNASQSRNSDRGGLGVRKHLSGQKSYLQVQLDLEDKLARPVSLVEVFMATHTRADGTFVDAKAKQVAEDYEKNLEETLNQLDADDLHGSDHSPENLLNGPSPFKIKMTYFSRLISTVTDDKGKPFGLGQLAETINKGKRRKCYSTASSPSILELQDQLEAARVKLVKVDEENARRDEEQRLAQSRITSLEMVVSYLKNTYHGFSDFMANATTPPHQQQATAANATVDRPAEGPANGPANGPNTSPLSNTSSTFPLP